MTKPTILIIDDDASIRLVISQTLSADGYAVRATGSLSALHKWVREGKGDVVITDVYLGEECVFDLMPSLKLERPELPFIVMSGQNTILTAASASEHGAFDYLPKPFDIETLSGLVARALQKKQSPHAKLDHATKQAERDAGLPLIGRSEAMQEVYRLISRMMNVRLPVLIEGEVGTGKELAARAIHDLGKFNHTPFLKVSFGELGEAASADFLKTLTDTPQATLYIDEVGRLSATGQASLLSILSRFKDLRFIAATHMDLSQRVKEETFRKDLFYRLNTVRLLMPPLRARKEDIPDLAKAFMIRAEKEGLSSKQLDKEALGALEAYHWPGNVRELENLIYGLCAISPDKTVKPGQIEKILQHETSHTDASNEGQFESELHKVLQSYIIPDLLKPMVDTDPKLYSKVCEAMDRSLISMALSATSGNKVRAATLLGINRNTLRAKIASLKITDE